MDLSPAHVVSGIFIRKHIGNGYVREHLRQCYQYRSRATPSGDNLHLIVRYPSFFVKIFPVLIPLRAPIVPSPIVPIVIAVLGDKFLCLFIIGVRLPVQQLLRFRHYGIEVEVVLFGFHFLAQVLDFLCIACENKACSYMIWHICFMFSCLTFSLLLQQSYQTITYFKLFFRIGYAIAYCSGSIS